MSQIPMDTWEDRWGTHPRRMHGWMDGILMVKKKTELLQNPKLTSSNLLTTEKQFPLHATAGGLMGSS